ncbi:MAG: winged helix-turn-helix domain-containing protein [Thermoproteota archaeon]|nr:winged helix-turn-helix domain-containing protein [Thermoproteota archaeon]
MSTKVYRGRYEITAQMLSIINNSGNEGATRTTVMYKSFLSHAQLKEYLSFLVEKGLVNEIPQQLRSGNEKMVYKITEKGVRFLWVSAEIERIVGLD